MSKINLTKVAGNYDMRLAGSSTFDVLGLVLTLECPTDDSRSCSNLDARMAYGRFEVL